MIMLCLTLMASIKSMSCYCLASLTLNYLSQHSVIFSETHNLQSHTKLKVSNLSKVGWTPLKIIISRYISLRLKINSRVLHIQFYVFFFSRSLLHLIFWIKSIVTSNCSLMTEVRRSLMKWWKCMTKIIPTVKMGFIKRIDKGWITTVKDLDSWRFERWPFVRANDSSLETINL